MGTNVPILLDVHGRDNATMVLLTVSPIIFKIGKEVIKVIKRDLDNRYNLLEPWKLPELLNPLPEYEDEYFLISKETIIVKPYSGNTCNGATFAPDNFGKFHAIIGAIFHDPWYMSMENMAKEWDMNVDEVRKIGDKIFFGILTMIVDDEEIEGNYIPKTFKKIYYKSLLPSAYYTGASVFGKPGHWIGKVWSTLFTILIIFILNCSFFSIVGCQAPSSPFKPGQCLVMPVYEKVDNTQRGQDGTIIFYTVHEETYEDTK